LKTAFNTGRVGLLLQQPHSLLLKYGSTLNGRTELPALPVSRDVKVIAHRALRFEVDGGSFYVAPWMRPQTIPESFLNHPYFQSAKQNGWVEVIAEPEVQQPAKAEEVTRA
jgi:hypothetical protein